MADRGTWKILIGSETLADYEDVVKLEPNDGGPLVQVVPLLGGSVPFRANRGNTQITRRFTLVKEHATNADSVEFYLTDVDTYGGVHDVTLTHKDHSGGEATYVITNAEVQIATQEPIGVCTISTVTLIGGPATLQP